MEREGTLGTLWCRERDGTEAWTGKTLRQKRVRAGGRGQAGAFPNIHARILKRNYEILKNNLTL